MSTSNKQYCTYLTHYTGDKLPEWYIGSTSIEKILNGYNGTVTSKRYKSIWIHERKNNPHLFKTRILKKFYRRKIALIHELKVQKLHQVVKNNNYINMSYAQKNGFFGRDVSGKNNPMYGKLHNIKSNIMNSSSQLKDKSAVYNTVWARNNITGEYIRDNINDIDLVNYTIGREELTQERKLAISNEQKGRVFIFNKIDKKQKKVKIYELDYYLNNGWQQGVIYKISQETREKLSSNVKDRIWINNKIISKLINPTEFYLYDGFSKGRLRKS